MIDNFKIRVPIFDELKFRKNPLLKWNKDADDESEQINYRHCTYKITEHGILDLKLIKKENKYFLDISNSIHKFWHGANHTDFTIKDLLDALQFLENSLQIDLESATLHRLEFGVNIATDRLPPEIFKHYLRYRKEPFKVMLKKHNVGNKKATGIVCEYTQFCIKVYDKGLQHNLDYYLMRFEAQVNKMQHFERSGISINYLKDLFNTDVLQDLGNALMNIYDGIMKSQSTDPESLKGLKNSDFDLWKLGQNVEYWNELKIRCNNDNNTYYRKRKRFLELCEIIKTDDLHEVVKAKILSKWEYLTDISHLAKNGESDHKFTTFENVPNESNPTPPMAKVTTNLPLIISVNYESIIEATAEQKQRFENRKCMVCRKDISYKRRDAKTCSKVCRNGKSNSINDHLKPLKKDAKITGLFDTSEFVNLEVLKEKKRKRLDKF